MKKAFLLLTAFSWAVSPAQANHGVQAAGAAMEFIIQMLIVVVILTIINFIILIGNVYRKSSGLRLVSVLLTFPLIGVSILALGGEPLVGFLGFALIIVQYVLIYHSHKVDTPE